MKHSLAFLTMFLLVVLPMDAQQAPPAQPAQPSTANLQGEPAKPTAPATITVPTGTRLPLVLVNTVTTRSARPGDPIYFETLYPVTIENRIVIPAGSFVRGQVTQSKRPGRVKGRGELMVRFDELILPNGYTISLSANVTQAGTGGGEKVDPEGKVKGDSEKGRDAGTIATTTLGGASIGSIAGAAAGSVGKGAAIGSGAGAAVGLLGVLLTRGPEVQLPRGTTLDVLTDHDLVLDGSRINFTDAGRSSVLPAPSDRTQDHRSRMPLSRFPFPY